MKLDRYAASCMRQLPLSLLELENAAQALLPSHLALEIVAQPSNILLGATLSHLALASRSLLKLALCPLAHENIEKTR